MWLGKALYLNLTMKEYKYIIGTGLLLKVLVGLMYG
mgnify:CR=1 FL=1